MKKPLIDMQKIRRKKLKHTINTTKRNYKEIQQDRKKGTEKQWENNYKMSVVKAYLSLITLNISGLNFPVKRCRVA